MQACFAPSRVFAAIFYEARVFWSKRMEAFEAMGQRLEIWTALALIIILLGSSGPAAVLGRISKIVINAINRVSALRLLAHIRNEIREFVPAFADRDTSAAVMTKGYIVRICTALMHSNPYVILQTSRCSMRSASRAVPFALKASATSCIAVFEASGKDDCFIPANADAVPHGVRPFIRGTGNDGKPSENLSRQIAEMGPEKDIRVAILSKALVMRAA